MLQIRPHHLLDIISDLGAGITHTNRKPHPFGAAVNDVTRDLLAVQNPVIQLTDRIDTICLSCSQLKNKRCTARLSDTLLMRDYNDVLDDALFALLDIHPGQQIQLKDFIKKLTPVLVEAVHLFTEPNIPIPLRLKQTSMGIAKLI